MPPSAHPHHTALQPRGWTCQSCENSAPSDPSSAMKLTGELHTCVSSCHYKPKMQISKQARAQMKHVKWGDKLIWFRGYSGLVAMQLPATSMATVPKAPETENPRPPCRATEGSGQLKFYSTVDSSWLLPNDLWSCLREAADLQTLLGEIRDYTQGKYNITVIISWIPHRPGPSVQIPASFSVLPSYLKAPSTQHLLDTCLYRNKWRPCGCFKQGALNALTSVIPWDAWSRVRLLNKACSTTEPTCWGATWFMA